MAWDDDLGSPHREIAESGHKRIGVLAGPGTGKTSFGLMRRVVRLLEAGVSGDRILLLSFTRVAAGDLRDKVAALDAPGIENVRATTLHAYCFRLLQQESVLAISGRVPRILLDHEVDLMLRDIDGDFGSIHERRRLLEAFVAGWARTLRDHPGIAATGDDREFEQRVMKWLREHRAMLIGEVVPEANRYLTNNPEADELDAFDHVIVDEYQDLNALEQRLLDQLTVRANLCVAGDDDQSIYSVRYANPEGIQSYLARPDVEGHSIQLCGRCPENVLSMANSLISQAPGRDKGDLVPRVAGTSGIVAIVQWPDVETEIDGIVSAIAEDVGSNRVEPGQILVLTNWRKIGERICSRLNSVDIRARSFFSEEELNSDEGKEALALLRLVVDDRDAPALRVILGLGDASGRTDAYQRLLDYCRSNAMEPADVLARLQGEERLGLNVPALVHRFEFAMGRIDQLRQYDLAELVDTLFPEGQGVTTTLRAAAIDALVDAKNSHDVLRTVVESITQDDVPQNPDFVRVMSLHKSKGLTSPIVYIVGAVHGILPTIRSTDATATQQASYEEGRRLFYVAVTRASEELTISGSISMDLADANARGVRYDRETTRRFGDRFTIRTLASPYIAELGPSAPPSVRGEDWLRNRGGG